MNIITLILFLVFVPESPKWLYSKGRFEECQDIMIKVAKFNNKPLDAGSLVFKLKNQTLLVENESKEEIVATQSMSPLKLISADRILMRNQVCMIFVWMGSSFSYYMLNMFVKYLKGDIFTNSIVMSVSESCGCLMGFVIYKFIGLKAVLTYCFLVSISGMVGLFTVQTSSQSLISLFVLAAKIGVSASFSLAYIGNQQMFPPLVLATSIGLCNLFARTVTVFASMVAELKPEIVPASFFIGFCVFGVIASLSIHMPRTQKT